MKVTLAELAGLILPVGFAFTTAYFLVYQFKDYLARRDDFNRKRNSDEEILHHVEADGNAGYYEPKPEGRNGLGSKKIEQGKPGYGQVRMILRRYSQEPPVADGFTAMGDRTS